MASGRSGWRPQHIRKANAQWDPLEGIWAFGAAWQLEHRVLFLTHQIPFEDTPDIPVTSSVVCALRVLDAMDPGKPITFYINSPGGDVHAGMSIIQTMRDLRSPVHTFVLSEAASMAAVVAVAGAKRLGFPTSRWLLHRDHGVAAGDHEDLLIAAKEMKAVDKMADQVILNFTRIVADELEEMQKKDRWFGAEEALKRGLVDEIVIPRQGPENLRQRRRGGAAWLPYGVG